MDRNDWAAFFYRAKPLGSEELPTILARDAVFFDMVWRYRGNTGWILDAGCGPARRMIAFSAARKVSIVLLDRDPVVLEMARANAAGIEDAQCMCIQYDFLELATLCAPQQHGVITHHGVLEHYEPNEIAEIITQQLRVCGRVVCAVPIASDYNETVFCGDGISRNLWPAEEWVRGVLRGFDVREWRVVRSNKDELVAALVKD